MAATIAIAANMEVTWKDVLSSIDNLLMETEIQDNNSDFRVPRSDISPQQTRNQMAISVLLAVVDMELDLDRNVGQVLVDSCVTLVEQFCYIS